MDNTGPRLYQVIEFDFKEKNKDGSDTPDAPMLRSLAADNIGVADLGVSLHLHLAELAPLVMIVHSGGKSEHGWYAAKGLEEPTLEKFHRYAASLGADPMTFTSCQMVRMPGGRRESSGAVQTVRFFEPRRAAK